MENKNYKEYLKDITTFIFDIDGVMTPCQILVTTEGELLRSMNVRDGFALKQAVNKGYNVCIITGGTNQGTKIRFNDLGIYDIYMGNNRKMEPLNDYISKKNIKPEWVSTLFQLMSDFTIEKVKTTKIFTYQNATISLKKVNKEWTFHRIVKQ